MTESRKFALCSSGQLGHTFSIFFQTLPSVFPGTGGWPARGAIMIVHAEHLCNVSELRPGQGGAMVIHASMF